METTLNAIREKRPCRSGWEKLLRTLGKTQADDAPVTILQILDSNGLDDAIWCLRAVAGHDREIRLFAVWCARQVQHLMTDPRSLAALDVAERYAKGDATPEELDSAWSAARSAAAAAAESAAAESAARSAAASAAESAELAAYSAAWSAAELAARSASAAQEKELRRICAACEVAQ